MAKAKKHVKTTEIITGCSLDLDYEESYALSALVGRTAGGCKVNDIFYGIYSALAEAGFNSVGEITQDKCSIFCNPHWKAPERK